MRKGGACISPSGGRCTHPLCCSVQTGNSLRDYLIPLPIVDASACLIASAVSHAVGEMGYRYPGIQQHSVGGMFHKSWVYFLCHRSFFFFFCVCVGSWGLNVLHAWGRVRPINQVKDDTTIYRWCTNTSAQQCTCVHGHMYKQVLWKPKEQEKELAAKEINKNAVH